MFGEKYRLRRNWLKGYFNVRTFEGHTQGVFGRVLLCLFACVCVVCYLVLGQFEITPDAGTPPLHMNAEVPLYQMNSVISSIIVSNSFQQI